MAERSPLPISLGFDARRFATNSTADTSNNVDHCWCCSGLIFLVNHFRGRSRSGLRSPQPPARLTDNHKQPAAHRYHCSCPLCPHHSKPRPANSSSQISLAASANRIRIQSSFCTLFFPTSLSSFHSLFADAIATTTNASSPSYQVMVLASDTLCTLQLAVRFADRALLLESLRMHGRVLHRLQRVLSTSPPHGSGSDDVASRVAAIYFLLKTSSFLCTAWDAPSAGWMAHTAALGQLLHAGLPPHEAPGRGRWGYLAFSSSYALAYGLNAKRALPHASLWNPSPDGTDLDAVAMRVPDALQTLEAVRTRDRGAARTRAAVRTACALYTLLRARLADLQQLGPPSSWPVRTRDAFPDFCAALCQDGAGLDTLFPTAWDFSDFFASMRYRTAWLCLLVLGSALLDLRRHRWYLLPALCLRELEDLDARVDRHAEDLCRALPYHCQPAVQATGRVCSIEVLHYLEQHFERNGAERHLAWCRALREKMLLGSLAAKLAAMEIGPGATGT